MDHTVLQSFLTVAECGSFSKAAERLFISSTAVMKQINGLEEEIGVKLFARTNRGLTLTEAGQSFGKDEVTPKIWTKNIRLYGNEYGTQPGSFLLI